MNAESEQALRAHQLIASPSRTDPGWRATLSLIVVAWLAILGVYWQTAASLVAIWERSETFAHGFLILPISLWLIWRKRRDVATMTPAPDLLGFVLLGGAGLAWLVAAAGQVQVVQQYAMVAMLPAAVIAIAGREVAWRLLFPLAFLFLGVPIGETLVPPLMIWTADFTVTALQLTGIPVLREGTFFTIPSGHWSVVEGCSGLRYLIASTTVGVLFAYLNYTKFSKRVYFVIASIIVPIIANGMRAYMIVMIAHLSEMKYALGIDHIIYGWVFFGIVMLLLFWVGSFWRDPELATDVPASSSGSRWLKRTRLAGAGAQRSVATGANGRRAAEAACLAVIVAAAVWVAGAAWINRINLSRSEAVLAAPIPAAGWALAPKQVTDWRPHYQGARQSEFLTYRKGDREIALYLGFYRNQRAGAELVTSTNIMIVQKHPEWNNMGDLHRVETLGEDGPVEIRQSKLKSPNQRLLIWDWYRISGRDLTNPYLGKLLLARDRLLARGDDSAAVIIATPYVDKEEPAIATLREFVHDMLPSIDAALARVGARIGTATTAGASAGRESGPIGSQ